MPRFGLDAAVAAANIVTRARGFRARVNALLRAGFGAANPFGSASLRDHGEAAGNVVRLDATGRVPGAVLTASTALQGVVDVNTATIRNGAGALVSDLALMASIEGGSLDVVLVVTKDAAASEPGAPPVAAPPRIDGLGPVVGEAGARQSLAISVSDPAATLVVEVADTGVATAAVVGSGSSRSVNFTFVARGMTTYRATATNATGMVEYGPFNVSVISAIPVGPVEGSIQGLPSRYDAFVGDEATDYFLTIQPVGSMLAFAQTDADGATVLFLRTELLSDEGAYRTLRLTPMAAGSGTLTITQTAPGATGSVSRVAFTIRERATPGPAPAASFGGLRTQWPTFRLGGTSATDRFEVSPADAEVSVESSDVLALAAEVEAVGGLAGQYDLLLRPGSPGAYSERRRVTISVRAGSSVVSFVADVEPAQAVAPPPTTAPVLLSGVPPMVSLGSNGTLTLTIRAAPWAAAVSAQSDDARVQVMLRGLGTPPADASEAREYELTLTGISVSGAVQARVQVEAVNGSARDRQTIQVSLAADSGAADPSPAISGLSGSQALSEAAPSAEDQFVVMNAASVTATSDATSVATASITGSGTAWTLRVAAAGTAFAGERTANVQVRATGPGGTATATVRVAVVGSQVAVTSVSGLPATLTLNAVIGTIRLLDFMASPGSAELTAVSSNDFRVRPTLPDNAGEGRSLRLEVRASFATSANVEIREGGRTIHTIRVSLEVPQEPDAGPDDPGEV